MQIFTIGIGTKAGSNIPINGQPHRDTQGNVVITKLQDSILRQLARDTSGIYTHINTEPEKAVAQAIQSMNQYEKQGREIEIPRELYQWFLAPGIILLILSALINTRFKSSIPTLLCLTFFTTSSPSQADDSSWINTMSTEYLTRPAQIKAGYSALQKKQYQEAIDNLTTAKTGTQGDQHAKLSLAIAQAAYCLNQYDLATQEYSQALLSTDPQIQSISQYNLANTLYKKHTATLNVPAEQTLTQYLENQIRNAKLTNTQLDNIEEGLANALTHYTDLLNITPDNNSAKSNKQATQQVIQAIKDARKKFPQQKKKQPDQDKEDPQKKESETNKKQNNNDKKQSDQPKKEPNKNQQGDQNGDQKEGQQGPEKKDKPDDNNKGDHSPQPKEEPNDGDQEKQDQKANQPKNNDNNSDSEKPSKFNNKKEALDFLKKHSDTSKKPLTNRRGYYPRRPTIDW